MSLYRVTKLLNTDRSNNLIFACNLQELLGQKVVFISIDELWNVFNDFENIELVLFDCLTGKISIMKPQTKYVTGQNFHLFISLHIMHIDNIEIVKTVIERIANFEFQINYRVKYSNFFKLDKFHDICHLALKRLDALNLFNQHAVNRNSQKILNFTFQW